MNLANIRLILFFTRAVTLSRWEQMGILEREVALYKRLRSHLGRVSLVTSGGPEELKYQEILGDIRILHNRWRLSPNVYSLLAPFLHWKALKKGTVYKTNQLDGAWTALFAGKLHRKPVIVRAGYLWAEHFSQQISQGKKSKVINHLQTYAFKSAQAINVTTETMKRYVIQQYNIDSEKINVISNYVDTDVFRPASDIIPIKGRICYVGRLHPRKNLTSLIQAVADLPGSSLVLIGQGEQQAELEALAQHCGANVQFLGIIPNYLISQEINRSEIFILPSLFEGHPKALIEAMACGIAAVGTNVEGIRKVIRHEETGLLCPPNVDGIKSALQTLLADGALRSRLGQAACNFVKREYSLNQIIEGELSILQGVQEG